MLHFVSHMGMTRADESLSGSWFSRMWEKLVVGAFRGRFSVLCDSLGSLARSAGLERTGIDFMSIDVESLELPVRLRTLRRALARTPTPPQPQPQLPAQRRPLGLQVLRSFDWSIPVGFMVVETAFAASEDATALVKLVQERGNMVKVDIGELPWYQHTQREDIGTGKKSVNTWFVRKDLHQKLHLKNGRLDVNGEHFHVVGPEITDLGRYSQEYAGAQGATMKREGGGCVSPGPSGVHTKK